MSLSNWFWIFYLLGIIFGFGYPALPPERRPYLVGFGSLILIILIGLLGWQVFGSIKK